MRSAIATGCMAILLALAVGSCGGGASGRAPGGDGPGAMVVEIEAADGFVFNPAHVTVAAGTTVRWTNRAAVPHTITSGASSRTADQPGALVDHALPSGARFELTLTTAGEWPYFCRYHEGMGMVGLVTVTAGPVSGQSELMGNQNRSSGVVAGDAMPARTAAQRQQPGR